MNRHESREQAFIFLFERSFKNETLDEIIESAKTVRELEVSNFAKKLFDGVMSKKDDIDKIINENLRGWKMNRISRVAATILRIATYEIMFVDNIPSSVSIDEAVKIAKIYGTDEDSSFINGILSGINKKLESVNG